MKSVISNTDLVSRVKELYKRIINYPNSARLYKELHKLLVSNERELKGREKSLELLSFKTSGFIGQIYYTAIREFLPSRLSYREALLITPYSESHERVVGQGVVITHEKSLIQKERFIGGVIQEDGETVGVVLEKII